MSSLLQYLERDGGECVQSGRVHQADLDIDPDGLMDDMVDGYCDECGAPVTHSVHAYIVYCHECMPF